MSEQDNWNSIVSDMLASPKPAPVLGSGITFQVRARGGLWQVQWDGFESQWLDTTQLYHMLIHFGMQLQSIPEKKDNSAYKAFQHKVFKKVAKIGKTNAPRDLDLDHLGL